jgi:hypothetical protein
MIILNVEQAARFLGKTKVALQAGYREWHIPYFMLGSQIKFTQEGLEAWVQHRLEHPETVTWTQAQIDARAARKGRKLAHRVKKGSRLVEA